MIRRINAFVSEDHGEPVAPHGGTVLHFTPCRRLPAAKPEEASLSSRRLQRTSKFMRRDVDENKLKGLLTVGCRKGKVAYCECCRLMDEQDSMQPDTLFRIFRENSGLLRQKTRNLTSSATGIYDQASAS